MPLLCLRSGCCFLDYLYRSTVRILCIYATRRARVFLYSVCVPSSLGCTLHAVEMNREQQCQRLVPPIIASLLSSMRLSKMAKRQLDVKCRVLHEFWPNVTRKLTHGVRPQNDRNVFKQSPFFVSPLLFLRISPTSVLKMKRESKKESCEKVKTRCKL